VRIAVLEDDEHLGQLMQLWMEAAGHNAHLFTTGQEFMGAVKRDTYDLFMLDWMLPDTSGDKVLEWIREHIGWQVPVLFVTQNDSQEDIVKALEKGADDYMVKPVQPMEMLARLTALGRRVKQEVQEETVIDRSPYQLDLNTHTFSCRGEVIPLTQKEFDLALFMFQNVGRILSRAHILDSVWGRNPEINTRTVDIHISRLRKKLELSAENGWKLSGIYNHGYRLERAYSGADKSSSAEPVSAVTSSGRE